MKIFKRFLSWLQWRRKPELAPSPAPPPTDAELEAKRQEELLWLFEQAKHSVGPVTIPGRLIAFKESKIHECTPSGLCRTVTGSLFEYLLANELERRYRNRHPNLEITFVPEVAHPNLRRLVAELRVKHPGMLIAIKYRKEKSNASDDSEEC